MDMIYPKNIFRNFHEKKKKEENLWLEFKVLNLL